jgi:polysaccharide biosynthesis protein PelE
MAAAARARLALQAAETAPTPPRYRGGDIEFAVAAGISLAAEIVFLLALTRGLVDWLLASAAHLALSAGIALWAWRRGPRRADGRPFAILAATLPFTGPLAPAALLVLFPAYMWFRRTATPFDEWYRSLFPETPPPIAVQLYQAIVRRELPGRDSAPVVSYMDVMRHGSVDQRIAVIATLTRNFRPVFAPVLRAAIADGNAEVRVQAATAVAKLTDDFVRRVQALDAQHRKRPEDRAALRRLAEAYDDYAFLGILDGEHEQNNRVNALQLWLRYAELEPDDRDARLKVGRLLMRLGRHEVAATWLERAIAEGRASKQALLWYMESLYALGRTEELRAVARSVAGDLSGDRKIAASAISAAELWSGRFTAPAAHNDAAAARGGAGAAS